MVILTGATGFMGAFLLEALINNKYEVVVLKRSTSDTSKINHLLDNIVCYDLDLQPLEVAFENHSIDGIIHTACDYGKFSKDLFQITENNLMFGIKLLDACLKYKVRFFVNTDTLLPRELNEYSLSKKQFVDWLKYKSRDILVVNFRLEYIYGKSDDNTKMVPMILTKLKQKISEIHLTEGNQKRDFIFIDDVISAILIVLRKISEFDGFVEFDVGTGDSVTLKYFLEQIKYEYENSFGVTGTKLGFGKLPYRENEIMDVEVDNSALINLGWSPQIKLQDGIRKIINQII